MSSCSSRERPQSSYLATFAGNSSSSVTRSSGSRSSMSWPTRSSRGPRLTLSLGQVLMPQRRQAPGLWARVETILRDDESRCVREAQPPPECATPAVHLEARRDRCGGGSPVRRVCSAPPAFTPPLSTRVCRLAYGGLDRDEIPRVPTRYAIGRRGNGTLHVTNSTATRYASGSYSLCFVISRDRDAMVSMAPSSSANMAHGMSGVVVAPVSANATIEME